MESKSSGCDTALNLNLTVFYLISQQFGTRGCQGHHQLRVEHLKFVNNPCTGTTEYVEWVEGPTKTRQAGLRKVNRRIMQNTAPLQAQTWCLVLHSASGYQQDRLLHEKSATMGGLDITKKHFTNHSVRKTTIRKLKKAGVSNDKIIAITGHPEALQC